MRYSLYILAILFLNSFVSAENITDAYQIRKIIYADGLKRNGLAVGYYFEYIKENDSTNNSGQFFSLAYGLSDHFDACFKVPYYIRNQDSTKIDGLGDVGLGLKYNFNPGSDDLLHSLLGQITLPTGYNGVKPNLDGMFSYGKKSFELDYLLSYRKDFLAIHGNLGFKMLDNRANKNPEDMTFNYKLGFDYCMLESPKRSWWLKWEFETTHSLTDYENSISGSQFAGISGRENNGFAFHFGAIQQLYKNKSLGLQGGVSYLLPGTLREKTKKLFELYPRELKVELLEFIKDDTLRTYDYLSEMLEEKLGKSDSIEVVLTKNGSKDFLKKRSEIIAKAQSKGQSLVVFGKILESSFEKTNLVRIPAIFMLPKIEHKISVEIIIVDTKQDKIVFKEILNATSYLQNGARLFTTSDYDSKWFLSAAEELQLIRTNSAKLTNLIATRLSQKY